MKKIILLFLIIFISGCNSDNRKINNKKIPLSSVESMDIKKYMGLWYEIGRYPNSFQKKECDLVTAEYKLLKDGTVKVINSCWEDSIGGKRIKSIEGKAVLVKNEVSKLKVTFFWPFSGNYWVIELDEKEYAYAVVSEPNRKYLWILARNPIMEKEKLKEITDKLEKNGFNSKKIVWNRYMKDK